MALQQQKDPPETQTQTPVSFLPFKITAQELQARWLQAASSAPLPAGSPERQS